MTRFVFKHFTVQKKTRQTVYRHAKVIHVHV
jgi:hypothetical protein